VKFLKRLVARTRGFRCKCAAFTSIRSHRSICQLNTKGFGTLSHTKVSSIPSSNCFLSELLVLSPHRNRSYRMYATNGEGIVNFVALNLAPAAHRRLGGTRSPPRKPTKGKDENATRRADARLRRRPLTVRQAANGRLVSCPPRFRVFSCKLLQRRGIALAEAGELNWSEGCIARHVASMNRIFMTS